MTSGLRDDAGLRYLEVGEALPTDVAHARAADYLVVREPAPREDVILLQSWVCPTCGTPFLWARVSVHDGVIAAVEPVEFDAAIATAHYVDGDAVWLVADRAGVRSPSELTEEEMLTALRAW
jgi:hypothetical protein